MRGFLPVSATCLFTAGCGIIPNGVICTDIFVYGVNITVANENGDPVSGAALTLTEGDDSEILEELQPGVYVGAGERAGTYTLTVEADGFEGATIENLVVDADVCHVIPINREVTLVPS